MKFRVVRESEFENRKPKTQNPLRDTAYADKAVQSEEYPTAWCVEIADLEELRNLHIEMMQITGEDGEPSTAGIDFVPHYAETPADCDGIIFIFDRD